jgi:hypothetical protein
MSPHFHRWATPSAQPVEPGKTCPANRTRPSRVRGIAQRTKYQQVGIADCAQCGAPAVTVTASTDERGARMTAFYYDQHTAPLEVTP